MKKLITRILFLSLLTAAPLWAVPDPETTATVVPASGSGTEAESAFRVTVTYRFPEGWHQTKQVDFFYFELAEETGPFRLGALHYPEGRREKGLINYYGETELSAPLYTDRAELAPGTYTIPLRIHWQLCDEAGACYFPASTELSVELEVSPRGGDIPGAASGTAPRTLLSLLFFAFLGGLLLNIMPCVLPVLSIKALSLAKQGGGERRTTLNHALLYTAGILISMLILALAVVALKATGESIGWGFQFQNRGFVLFLATLIFLFGLSLFDLYPIAAPVIRQKSGLPASGQKGRGYSGSFASGMLAVLLATPCTAPFLGTAVGFAFSQPPALILLMFLVIGAGLSLPFLLLGFFPGLVSRIPRPGPWMDRFRQFMGFLLMGTVLWLLDVVRMQNGGGYLMRTMAFLLFTALLAWFYGVFKRRGTARGRMRVILLLLLILGAGTGSALLRDGGNTAGTAGEPASAESGYGEWEAFTPQLIASHRQEGRPLFLAFSAGWCMTCRINERSVLFTEEIDSFLRERGIVRIHGDYTNRDPVLTEWMARFQRAGVPFYLVYPPGGGEPILLPETLTKELFKERISAALEG